jgi:class I lanthipeptide synthase
MKYPYKEWYEPQQSFVVRTPLFPVEKFFQWAATGAGEKESAAHVSKRTLKEFYTQPLTQEALFIASPDLHKQLLLWLEDKIDKPDKKEKTELALVKYMTRMCTRCTPFGLFASCTAGNFSGTTQFNLSGNTFLRRHARLDMDYVCELHSYVLQQKETADQLLFFPNSSLYKSGDQWRYVESRFAKEKGRSYHLVEISQSPQLEKIFIACRQGQRPRELARLVVDDDVSWEDALEFVYELIQCQVLVNDPTVTGEEYFPKLLHELTQLSKGKNYAAQLVKVRELLHELDDVPEQNIARYLQIVNQLESMPVPLHLKTLIQVDSYRCADSCTLSENVNEEILKGITVLRFLNGEQSANDAFTHFKSEFVKRFEHEFVPLSRVLDTESGIAYGKFARSSSEESPLIDHLHINNDSLETSVKAGTESFKWDLYERALREHSTHIVISDETVSRLSNKELSSAFIPDSICAMVKIIAASAADVDSGKYFISLQSVGGPSGANLLGRFCHLHPKIESLTRTLLKQEGEHHPGCIYAEIVHLPESRVGNILMRPILRQYEIPYLCGSAVDEQFQIPISDLLVGVVNDRVVLVSRKLNKEIIPRLTTAHNFHNTTLPIYQFLCDLQFQNIQVPSWNWGELASRPFLPRVTYDRFIFSKAKWLLTKEDCERCEKIVGDHELLKEFTLIKEQKRLPEYIVLSQGDNELLLHLNNIFCIKLLLAEVKKNGTVPLTEILDTPDLCWIKSPDGKLAGEFVVGFSKKKTEASTHASIPTVTSEKATVKRVFPVGSEWLYAKIYSGVGTAEKLLANVVAPFTEQLAADHIIDKFFFIRYNDPEHHIRIRFHNGMQTNFWKEVIPLLQKVMQPYFENQLVHSVQFDTYRREVERYGVETLSLSEDIFWYQSKAVLSFISMLEGDEGEEYRWRVALKAIDLFLDAFSFNLEQKSRFLSTLDKNYSAEFKIGSEQRKKIYERFANHKPIIDRLMSDDWKEDGDLSNAINIFKVDGIDYRSTIDEILSAQSVKENPKQLEQLLTSYLHMFVNRLFMGNQRKVELILYEYLWKIYESRLAREKNDKNILKTNIVHA